MKKLFLLLILSLFSFQAYAGSCSEGSDLGKSISADGTYFEYKCVGAKNSNKPLFANYLDDWTNEDLCRWMDAALIPEHISDEMYARKLVCTNNSEVIELINQATYVSEHGTVFPSPQPSAKVTHNSGFTLRINYKITL